MGAPPNVLVIEDNDGDVTLLQTAFAQTWPGVRMHVVANAERALAFIQRMQIDPTHPQVSLVLIDLNLPGSSGKVVLERLRTGAQARQVPAVVFSSSCRERDIEDCYQLGATMYVVKPSHWSGYEDLASSFAKLAALSGCCS